MDRRLHSQVKGSSTRDRSRDKQRVESTWLLQCIPQAGGSAPKLPIEEIRQKAILNRRRQNGTLRLDRGVEMQLAGQFQTRFDGNRKEYSIEASKGWKLLFE